MPNRSADILFQLIKSLEKAEKRHFKLYIRRSSARDDLKIIRLFDAIDKSEQYDEKAILKKLPGTEKKQLYNLKTHLYREIMASLRLLKSTDSLDLQLNEQFDYAHILYKKGLHDQSLKLLEKVKETAWKNQKFGFLTQVNNLEKRIETIHISRDMEQRADLLSKEASEINEHNLQVARLSNLALQLYSWFIHNGHVRNKEDEKRLRYFLTQQLPANASRLTGFYEQLYYYQGMSWYAFIRLDFLQYYRYAQKWVDLFDRNPLMIRVETGHYIKGLHNLLNAHFDLRNHKKFEETLIHLKKFAQTERVKENDNFRIQAFVYIISSQINQHFMRGSFIEGLGEVPAIVQQLKEDAIFIDRHRMMVLQYKIASLYFGSGDPATAIDYLHEIINEPEGLGNDLQSYARLMHLLAHYELGNDSIMDSLAKSVLRFMAKMKNLSHIEEAMIQFIRQSFSVQARQLQPRLEELLNKIKHLEKNPFETRAFAYLDIISWLESKVYHRPMSEIIHKKYQESKRK